MPGKAFLLHDISERNALISSRLYILVQHTISDPSTAWARAQQSLPSLPAHLKLHHSIPTPEGKTAICIWEAESIGSLKDYLDPMLGPSAKNEYFEVVNKEGVALPTALQPPDLRPVNRCDRWRQVKESTRPRRPRSLPVDRCLHPARRR